MKIIELDEVDSTNEYCKRLNCQEDVAVVAKRQSAGKGTHGRSFSSNEGGLYISVMKKYRGFDFANTFSVMVNACVAVCRTVEAFGLKPTIKWANDVLVGGKKICGTLIENKLGADGVCTSVVGMGLNVNNVLPEELRSIATTMSAEKDREIDIKRVQKTLIANLSRSYSVDGYKRYIDWFGREIILESNGVRTPAVALDVGADGCLICNIGGEIKRISSGEMSLKL